MTRALVAFVLVVMGVMGVAAAADAAYLEQRVQKEAAVALLGEDAFETTQLPKLLAADGAVDDQFGYSVSVSGSLIVVGAPYDDDKGSDSGSAYVFEKGADGAVTQLAKLTAADGAASDLFGFSVAVSGSLIVVSAKYDDDKGSNSGSAYVFQTNREDDVEEEADEEATGSGAADITATFDNVVDGLTFTTTVTKSSDGTYNVTAEQSNSTTTTAAFLGAAASAVMKSSVTRVGAPVVALAAVAAVAGVLFNKSRRRRSRVGADEETPLVEGTKYGAVHV